MLRRALKLRSRLSLFMAEDNSFDMEDSISKDDWIMLQIIHDLLLPFWKLTIQLQGHAVNGHYRAIWEVLPAMEILINHLEAASKIHTL